MKALVAALNRIATALEQLVPALTQATREARSRHCDLCLHVQATEDTTFDMYPGTDGIIS